MKLDKRILAMGAGAGVGVIVPTLLKKYVEPSYGAQIPYLDALGVWGTWHVFIPLVSGAAAIVVTQFTNLIRNDMISDTLAMYGFAALFSGIISGATESLSMPARAGGVMSMGARPVARIAPRAYNATATQTSVSRATIVS
jgi:hypothetical protein